VSQAIVLATAPVVGAVADFSGAKKRLLFLTYLSSVIATLCLGFAGPGDVVLALAFFVVSNVFFSTGENIVAAFLPEISTPGNIGRISGYGWALGYIGGLGCLLACYPLIRGGFGAENAGSLRLSFVVTAVFFLLGGVPTFLFLRERAPRRTLPRLRSHVAVGFRRVAATLSEVRRFRQLFRFLVVFLIYNCGIIIVVLFGSRYAESEIGMNGLEITVFFMVMQVFASLGALSFGFIQDALGSRAAILLSLLIWLGVCLVGYATTSVGLFYVVGAFAGIAMGAAQSAARALVGAFSPASRSGEFFGFWGLSWKLSGVIGPPIFGYVADSLGMRTAILVTAVFFVLGIGGMLFIDEAAGRRAAAEDEAQGGLQGAAEGAAQGATGAT
jgi:UMF1 family MFS transporter